jgi:hypothetical protein
MRLPVFGAAFFCASAKALLAEMGTRSVSAAQQPHALSATATSTFAVAVLFNRSLLLIS